jgi:hypothetical protein
MGRNGSTSTLAKIQKQQQNETDIIATDNNQAVI